ncbi:nitroreductase [Marinicella sp. W31]|uniref:nitroreductase family protein n=1 Tax=Marinicella sp. W31 TaxID=3023713 RepID=UPI003757FBF7
MNQEALDLMLNRRSVLCKNLNEPGPNPEQLNTILTIAARVPDHRKLEPWRFIVIEKQHREYLGQLTSTIKEDELIPIQMEIEAKKFMQAPVVICVVYAPVEHKTPQFEQLLSTGAVCQNINIAASALGFGSQWITGWCAYDRTVMDILGLDASESIAGYLFIGSCDDTPRDRQRPDLETKVSYWQKPSN